MTGVLTDADLPGFWRSADRASARGQRLTVLLNQVRLSGSIVGAVGGTLSWSLGGLNIWAFAALAGFSVALVAEVALLVIQPERDWYAGRALAESAKTLAWRYAVGAEPFPLSLAEEDARRLMRDRLAQVASKGQDRVTVASPNPDITDGMQALRRSSFALRREAYVHGRTIEQQSWYAVRADRNRRAALGWRLFLIAGEVLAVTLAAGRAIGNWQVDVSGIIAAVVASGAAWIALRQYAPLTSAYATAATELSLQVGRLSDTTEELWSAVVADAEEAISREHIMWLASRGSASRSR